MIVCSCHAVSDRDLHRAASEGLTDEQVAEATGAGTGCGVCRVAVAETLAGARAPCREKPCPGCPRRAAA